MTKSAPVFGFKSKAGVKTDCPTSQPPIVRQAASSCGPAALCIAPDTPLPASSDEFAELTTALARCSVMFPMRQDNLAMLSPNSAYLSI